MGLTIRWADLSGKPIEIKPSLVVAGLDWGGLGGDPLAFEVGGKAGGTWFNFFEVYTTRITHPELLKTLRKAIADFGIERIWCDQSQPHAVGFLQGHGIPALANQVKSVEYGARTVYGLLKTNRLLVVRAQCPALIGEFGKWGYPTDRHGELQGRRPLDRDNHALDALRYYIVGEGEIPPDEAVLSVFEQPRMYLNKDGQWVDNPVATMAQALGPRVEVGGWWDEVEAGDESFVLDD